MATNAKIVTNVGEVISDGWTVIQNISSTPVYLRYGAALGESLDGAIVIHAYEGLVAAVHGSGDILAATKGENSSAVLSVTAP